MKGLRDTAESGEELILDVDDKLLKREKRQISRASVANLCIAALTVGSDQSVSFDCVAQDVEDGAPVKDAKQVLSNFLVTGQTANYDL